eukprot:6091954-Pleurochrysis_carterae.AAC.1
MYRVSLPPPASGAPPRVVFPRRITLVSELTCLSLTHLAFAGSIVSLTPVHALALRQPTSPAKAIG